MKPRKYTKRKALKAVRKARKNAVAIAAPASRWALTSDGAFVYLTSPCADEIDGSRARSLVDFVRKLDGAKVAA